MPEGRAAPRLSGWGDRLRFLMRENLPGAYPVHGGRLSLPARGRGPDPDVRRRGHARADEPALPLPRRRAVGARGSRRRSTRSRSTARTRPSAPTSTARSGTPASRSPPLDDAKRLYSGFDLCAPSTSVSMTINGPAPIILAFFINAAIDQQVEKHLRETGAWEATEQALPAGRARSTAASCRRPATASASACSASPGDQVVDARDLRADQGRDAATVRGTVQADILKEDQAQNTCIFSTEFALKMMGDVQQYFVDQRACATSTASRSAATTSPRPGRTRSRQLAFTLANGFTIVEYYLARGMAIDDFAPNLSFFFSNGMDPEYAVIGRVARRIWARAMRERYGAEPAQPDAQVPHPDLGPQPARPGDRLQRHPHDAAGALRDLRQLQQPAHERLRRGDHDADRGIGAARGRDPADHQPRARAQLRARTRGRARS